MSQLKSVALGYSAPWPYELAGLEKIQPSHSRIPGSRPQREEPFIPHPLPGILQRNGR